MIVPKPETSCGVRANLGAWSSEAEELDGLVEHEAADGLVAAGRDHAVVSYDVHVAEEALQVAGLEDRGSASRCRRAGP